MKGEGREHYLPAVYVEVQVRLCDHHPIQHNVEHQADEDRAIARRDYRGRGVHRLATFDIHKVNECGVLTPAVQAKSSCKNPRLCGEL